MEKKYQVFISSTFTDLKEERKAVIECLLNAKYIPAGMEMFSASNEEQFKYIKKIIDNCDYYVLILGGRYGSINPSVQKSFTEMEYEYAKDINIPVLAFPFDNISDLSDEKRDSDLTNIERFRTTVMSSHKLCKVWRSTPELIGGILSSLSEAVSDNPRAGWTRGNSFNYDELLEQINHLQIEKQKDSSRIKELEACLDDIPTTIENLAGGEELYEVIITRKDYDRSDYSFYDNKIKLSWDKIFSLLGPYLQSSISQEEFFNVANRSIGTQLSYSYYKQVHIDCLQTIKYQLKIRGLINVVVRQNNSGKKTEVITLTKMGRDYLNRVISIKSNKSSSTTETVSTRANFINRVFHRL